jgi:hypothetical protein
VRGHLVALAQASPDLMLDSRADKLSGSAQGQDGGNLWTNKPNVWGSRANPSGSKSLAASGVPASAGLQSATWYRSNSAMQIVDDGPVVGKRAVEKAKKIAMLKDSEEASATAADRDEKQGTKQTEGKTFYLDADGQTWVDSQYKGEKVEEIAFASARYFELAKSSPKLASYLAVGQHVIFVYQGHAYKVTFK